MLRPESRLAAVYPALTQVATRMETLTKRDWIVPVLDEVEYLFEVIPPGLQDLAAPITDELHGRL